MYISVVFWDMILAFFQQGQNGPDLGWEKLTLFVKSIKLVPIHKRVGGDKFVVMKSLSLFLSNQNYDKNDDGGNEIC